MPPDRTRARKLSCLALTDAVVQALGRVATRNDLGLLMEALTREMGFRYYALAHHDDLRVARPGRVDLMDYPAAITDRLLSRQRYRRDPVIRACLYAGGAFLWSDLSRIITLDRQDRTNLEVGAGEGLNEGITVPYTRLGERMGSCTFAGIRRPSRAPRFLGPAQVIGIFAFQAARRLALGQSPIVSQAVKLYPRARDCIVLVGRGLSNKEIARALALTPRTVDGYLTEARRLFDAHGRTELVVSAVLAGEIGLDEL
jgi:LuxR family quorum-sensing system transcriptional regulator CciR